MKRNSNEQSPCECLVLHLGGSVVRVLDVSSVKGRKGRWPEVVLVELAQAGRKKLFDSPGALVRFVNRHKIFSQPARKHNLCTHSTIVDASGPGLSYYVMIHSKASMVNTAGTTEPQS